MKKLIIISLFIVSTSLYAAESNESQMPDSPEPTIPNNEIMLDPAASDKNFELEQIDAEFIRLANAKIACNKILAYAKQYASYYYTTPAPDRDASDRSSTETTSIEETIKNVCAQLVQQLRKNNLSSIDKKHLDFVLNTALARLLPDTLTLTFSRQLAEQLDIGIAQFFQDKGIETRIIPSEMREEFKTHRNDALRNLRQLMIKHHRNSATETEITTAISNAFEAFIQNISHVLLWNLVKAETSTIKKTKDASSSIAPNPECQKLREQLESLNHKESCRAVIPMTTLPLLAGQ